MENKVFYLPKFKDSGTLPKSTNKWLKTIGETILDFTPIVGDIKGLTNRAVPGIIPIWFGSKMFVNQNQEEK